MGTIKLAQQEMCTSRPTEELYECAGFVYKKNRYGDVFLDIDSVSVDDLSVKLTQSVEILKEKVKGHALLIAVPHEKAAILATIKKVGFDLYYADNEKTFWIIKNGSPIPAPYTARGSVQVIIVDNGKMLVVQECTRKGMLGLPAGNVDEQEFAQDAAVREVCEEVGMQANPRHLKLIAAVNRLNSNCYGATEYGYIYLIKREYVVGDIVIDPKEILKAWWVSIEELCHVQELDGCTVNPIINLIAQHINSGCAVSQKCTVPDYYRVLQSKDRALPGVVHVELIAQDIG